MCLVHGYFEGFVVVDGFQVGGEVGEDLEGEVAEGGVGSLEELAGVGFEEGEAEEEAEGFEGGGFAGGRRVRCLFVGCQYRALEAG